MSLTAPPFEPHLQQAVLPYLLLDGDGRLCALNPAAAQICGRPVEQLIGQHFIDLVDPFSREKAALMLAQAADDGLATDWELNHPRLDGPPQAVSYTAWRWERAAPQWAGLALCGHTLAAALSVTAQLAVTNQQLEGALLQLERAHAELKAAQAQLVRSEKLRSLGQLVAGVAHELNTPLGFISGNLDFLSERMPELATCSPDPELPTEINDALSESREGLVRIASVVRDLRSFARPDSPSVYAADLNASLAATVRIARTLCPAGVNLNEEYGAIPAVVCAPGQINQVLLNLLTNAVQAVGQRGNVLVSTTSDAQWVTISVTDNGVGMDETTLARLGEPFFTTRPIGAGMGLGLAVSMGIVERHGGQLEFSSSPGAGTTARLHLPITMPPGLHDVEGGA